MSSRKKIKVSEELLEQRIKECGTFSHEYLDALTDEQWETLRDGRIARLKSLKENVSFNEKRLGIWDLMQEYRFMRIKKIAHREKEIRDLYFAIEDKDVRLRAINDLYAYDLALLNYYHSTITIEAWNRYKAADRRTMFLDWTVFVRRLLKLLGYSAFVAAIVFLAHAVFGTKWDGALGVGGFVERYGVVVLAFLLIDFAWQRTMEIAQARKRLIDWQIAKARCDIDDNFTFGDEDIYSSHLFSEKERMTGEREGDLTDARKWHGVY